MKNAAWIGGTIGGVLLIVLIMIVVSLFTSFGQFRTYVQGELSGIKTNVSVVTTSAIDLAKITGSLQTDVSSLQTDVSSLKTQRDKDITDIKQDTEQQIMISDLKKQVEAVKQQAAVDKQFVEQGARITAVEKTPPNPWPPQPWQAYSGTAYINGSGGFNIVQAGDYKIIINPAANGTVSIDGRAVYNYQLFYLYQGYHTCYSSSLIQITWIWQSSY